jgi:hypothetical protein
MPRGRPGLQPRYRPSRVVNREPFREGHHVSVVDEPGRLASLPIDVEKKGEAMMDALETGSALPLDGIDAGAESNARWEVRRCPLGGVRDFESLLQAIRKGQHPIDGWDLERRLTLGVLWDWDDIRLRIRAGLLTAERLDEALHQGLADDSSRPAHVAVPRPP